LAKDKNKSTICFTSSNTGVTPDIAVKARRVSGSTHQVPVEIGSTQRKALFELIDSFTLQ